MSTLKPKRTRSKAKGILVIFTCILLCSLHANAYDFEHNGIYYNFIQGTDDEVEVTYLIDYRHDDFDGEGDYYNDIVIPDAVVYEGKTYYVTRIGEQAFRESCVESITIPIFIKRIGNRAFCSCSCLKKVTVEWKTPLIIGKTDPEDEEYYEKFNLDNIFDGTDLKNIELSIPVETQWLYQEAYVWKSFGKITERPVRR